MSATVFVDTNVFVYQLDARDPEKQERARAWLERLWTEESGRVSSQVLQELYVTVTRKLENPLAADEARKLVRSLLTWNPVLVDGRVLEAAWRLEDRYDLSWWDACIVAAAQAARCSTLLTEDLQGGQVLDGVEVVDPFTVPPQ